MFLLARRGSLDKKRGGTLWTSRPVVAVTYLFVYIYAILTKNCGQSSLEIYLYYTTLTEIIHKQKV